MKARFLGSASVQLGAPTREEAAALAAMPEGLISPSPPRASGVDRRLAIAARDAGGALAGGVTLVDVDWRERTARVAAAWGPQGSALRAEAIRLVARYAFEELALLRLEAEPADGAWRRALEDAGFRAAPQGPGRWQATNAFLPRWPA